MSIPSDAEEGRYDLLVENVFEWSSITEHLVLEEQAVAPSSGAFSAYSGSPRARRRRGRRVGDIFAEAVQRATRDNTQYIELLHTLQGMATLALAGTIARSKDLEAATSPSSRGSGTSSTPTRQSSTPLLIGRWCQETASDPFFLEKGLERFLKCF